MASAALLLPLPIVTSRIGTGSTSRGAKEMAAALVAWRRVMSRQDLHAPTPVGRRRHRPRVPAAERR